ncbi:hypothetical protein HOY82DRAFT_549207 [Tuber indicum]|nr:hypothetical protein HOY82DRAFT_549207 [Tuber indicum]
MTPELASIMLLATILPTAPYFTCILFSLSSCLSIPKLPSASPFPLAHSPIPFFGGMAYHRPNLLLNMPFHDLLILRLDLLQHHTL